MRNFVKTKSLLKQMTGYDKLRSRLWNEFITSTLYPFATKGHISVEEAQFLSRLVIRANDIEGPIIEVGTLFGYSTLVIVIAKNPQKELITVDKFRWNPVGISPEVHFELTQQILKEAIERHSARLIRADKREFYEGYEGQPPSLVFFDADHSYEETCEDLQWAKRVKAKIIAGHDYSTQFPGVTSAVSDVFENTPLKSVGSLFALSLNKKI